jgi:hypothetical protein
LSSRTLSLKRGRSRLPTSCTCRTPSLRRGRSRLPTSCPWSDEVEPMSGVDGD